MEKQLKDYLHLHLGCKVLAVGNSEEYDDEYFQEGDIGTFVLINNGSINIHATPDVDSYKYAIQFEGGEYVCGYNELFSNFKPILRPLSSMTGEEKKEIGFEAFNMLRNEQGDRVIPSKNIGLIWAAKQTAFLLKQGFDLFGLIEAGLAIDATSLPEQAG